MLPRSPGVYIFKGKLDEVLYVGKAVDLHSRINSYKHSDNPKTQILNSQIVHIETIVVESELEALILEVNLIKKSASSFSATVLGIVLR